MHDENLGSITFTFLCIVGIFLSLLSYFFYFKIAGWKTRKRIKANERKSRLDRYFSLFHGERKSCSYFWKKKNWKFSDFCQNENLINQTTAISIPISIEFVMRRTSSDHCSFKSQKFPWNSSIVANIPIKHHLKLLKIHLILVWINLWLWFIAFSSWNWNFVKIIFRSFFLWKA